MNKENFIVTPKVFASREKRFINMLIDIVGYYILSIAIGYIIGLISLIGFDAPLNYILTLESIGELVLSIIITLTYFIVLEILTQRSLGKFITKTMVVIKDGTKPSAKDIILRSLCRLIPFDALSFLGSEGRGWHDSVSDTYVVDIKKFNAQRDAAQDIDMIGETIEDI
jgi:uncharacterized RDD family membrane protein YckC